MAVHYLNYEKKFSCNQGHIVPIGLLEVLPGDDLKHKLEILLRTQPLISPVMHSAEVKVHSFFVPARLCWDGTTSGDNFQEFITGGEDGLNNATPPTIDMGASGAAVGSLADFLGVPTGVANLEVSALPFRAYALCYNEFYRDQDLIDPVTIDLTGGPDTTTNTDLLRAAWQKDYFTTCRPDTQKGDDVSIALSGDADVTTDADNNDFLGVKSTTQSNAIKSMDTDGGAARS